MLIYWSIVLFRYFCVLFEVFQLTALAVRGAGRRGVNFNINLDRVAISHEAVEGVQDFLRDASFAQRGFFSVSGVTMLKDAVAVAYSAIVS